VAKCPKCGTDVASPKKKWTMAGRPDKAGKRLRLDIGLFDCPKMPQKIQSSAEQAKSLKHVISPHTPPFSLSG